MKKLKPSKAPFELYDLETDLGETSDVYAKHPEVVKSLKAEITAIIKNGRSTPGAPQDLEKDNWKQLTWMELK